MSEQDRLKKIQLYAKFVRLSVGVFAVLFELLTGIEPPKPGDLLRGR